MTTATDNITNALAAAAMLERWADGVPMWTPLSGERWDAPSERRYQAEQLLEKKLLRLPSCELSTDSSGSHVELTLAGIQVRRQNCLANACRAWAAEIRRRAAR